MGHSQHLTLPVARAQPPQPLQRYQLFLPLAQPRWHQGVPIPPGSWDMVFLFGITDKPGKNTGTILSGSEDHSIAGFWGITQEPSALRNLCSVEAKPIPLPLHPDRRCSQEQKKCGSPGELEYSVVMRK